MSIDHDLARLAALHGIEPEHHDFFGAHHRASPDTLRALLGAMGVRIEREADVGVWLAETAQAHWRQPFKPVYVLDQNGPQAVSLRLPVEAGDARLAVRIETEGGAQLTSEAGFDAGTATASPDRAFRAGRLDLGHRLPIGEHDLEVRWQEGRAERSAATRLVVTPERCFAPRDLGGARLWGVSSQLYALRSADDLGIGDIGGLGQLSEVVAERGGAFVGLNPIHSLFSAEPRHIGPYSPSTRRFCNWIYLDLTAVPEVGETPAAAELLARTDVAATLLAARAAELVDYASIAPIKFQVLEHTFATFRARHLRTGEETARGRAFLAFRAEQGQDLERHATFETIFEQQYAGGQGVWSWRAWPDQLRDASSPGVATFAMAHQDRVSFYAWLQWLIDEQLAGAQARAKAAGMPIGLYGDLAVGVHPDGSATWGRPDVTVVGATVGAPPDGFNPAGQNWGLAPFAPTALRRDGYRTFLSELAWNMRHAGALRIDHAMALTRLFWIPEGAAGKDGTYVRYPVDDLIRLVALQSQRARCVVIGEDLGNVPDGFRDKMQRADLLSYRVLYFEREADGGFKRPEEFPDEALIGITTHDLATFKGFVEGRDLEWRHTLGMIADDAALDQARRERHGEVGRLLQALREAGELGWDTGDDLPYDALLDAVCRYLGKAPSALMFLQLEDILGDVEQPNLPGTTDEHPNWRRRMPVTIDELRQHPALARLAALVNQTGRDRRGPDPA